MVKNGTGASVRRGKLASMAVCVREAGMKEKKTLSLDEEVAAKLRMYAAGLHQTESAFVSMLINEIDRVAMDVVLSVKKGGAESGTDS